MARIGLLLTMLLATGPVAAREMSPRDVDALPARAPDLVERYGTDPLQVGELRLPVGKGPFPVAIVIHGGCWTKGFATARNTAPIASALVAKGIATWNIEYRQVGDPGAGWPGTFRDWGAAADHLRTLAKRYPLDLTRVIAVGHSAGAHGALWLAARAKLPPDSAVASPRPLRLAAAVAIDGPGDLAPFVGMDAAICGKPVIAPLMGGTPTEVPGHYRDGAPAERLPLDVPQYLAASAVLSPEAAAAYAAKGKAAGDRVAVLVPPPGADHFNIIAPGEPQWAAVEAFVLSAMPKK